MKWYRLLKLSETSLELQPLTHFYYIFFHPLRPLRKSIWQIPLDIRVHHNDQVQEWLARIVSELAIVETWSLVDDCALMAC